MKFYQRPNFISISNLECVSQIPSQLKFMNMRVRCIYICISLYAYQVAKSNSKINSNCTDAIGNAIAINKQNAQILASRMFFAKHIMF